MIVSMRIDDKIVELLKLYSKAYGITVSDIVRDTLTEKIDKDYDRIKREAEKEAREREKFLIN